jgi:hypothetical protein
MTVISNFWGAARCGVRVLNSQRVLHIRSYKTFNEIKNSMSVCRAFRNKGPEVPLLELIVAQQWDTTVPTVGTHCCTSDLGSNSCKNDQKRNNDLGPRQCNNNLCDLVWRTPLECQCTPKRTPFQSCGPVLIYWYVSRFARATQPWRFYVPSGQQYQIIMNGELITTGRGLI